jgi:hypothetical protein
MTHKTQPRDSKGRFMPVGEFKKSYTLEELKDAFRTGFERRDTMSHYEKKDALNAYLESLKIKA